MSYDELPHLQPTFGHVLPFHFPIVVYPFGFGDLLADSDLFLVRLIVQLRLNVRKLKSSWNPTGITTLLLNSVKPKLLAAPIAPSKPIVGDSLRHSTLHSPKRP
jgi:hypothetical protein